ncbi:hypothetical protein HYH03_018593 [Edaphochlamys debaryana]|uniref:Uncharacterized protein n=1 Tax=Edaphochlamys debaryana TaxID=47281 RepID=A0A836BMT2_9CHLO|nr:hypothetical protein HYH03_018593 [Edaphochlamys debaryana]|eukprot:KAG2482486.1 hypothetical protein HYH03_018593 [Edaphochlamys debaryana]
MDTNVVNNTVVQVPTEGMTRRSPPAAPFHDTMEDLETSLAQYYDVQALSLRTALYRLAVLEQRDGFRWRQLFFDHHPGDAGHRMMADLAVFLMQETALDLLLDPMTPEEEAELRRPLPGPMYPGNLSPAAPMCALGPSFAKLVVKTTGFHLTDEGRRKWGYVATAPGAELVVRVDTRRSGGGAAAGDPALLPEVMLFFHYLKSYDHMGRAEIRCVSGVVVEESERSGEEVAQMALSDGLLLDIFIPEATG